MTPSVSPSTIPTSAVPTPTPSISGSVVFVEMNTAVTESLSNEVVADIIKSAEETFGVFPGSVEAEITYDITGSVVMTIDGDYSEEELTSALQNSIADALNIHPSDVDVIIDSETGAVIYTINSATAEDAENLQDDLQLASVNEDISSNIFSILPEISNVTFFNAKDTILFLYRSSIHVNGCQKAFQGYEVTSCVLKFSSIEN